MPLFENKILVVKFPTDIQTVKKSNILFIVISYIREKYISGENDSLEF